MIAKFKKALSGYPRQCWILFLDEEVEGCPLGMRQRFSSLTRWIPPLRESPRFCD